MSSTLLRQIPGTSVVHRLWAGTKILCAAALSLLLMAVPVWPVLGLVAIFLFLAARLARVPWSALPRPPWWMWLGLAAGAGVNAVIGVPAVLEYLRILVFGILVFFGAMLVSWTTSSNDIAPAIAVLGAPLRKVRFPVDEWAVAIALCLRSLPLLLEEITTLRAARRLRPFDLSRLRDARESPLIDLVTATMAVALRRAGELGEAVTARGGTGRLTAYPSRPTRADAAAGVAMTAVCVIGVVVGIVF